MARLRPAALLLLLGLAAAAAQGVVYKGPAGCADLPPSPPVDLKAAPAGSGALFLTWSAPANGACVDEYQRSTSFNLTLSGLTNGIQYKIYVKAFSSKYRGGGEALVVAAPRSPCNPRVLPTQPTNLAITPGNGQLGICWGPPATGCPDTYRVGVRLADASRRAAPLVREYPQGGCVNVTSLQNGEFYEAQKGQCNAPFMRQIDQATKSVIQYCADACPCKVDPARPTAPSSRSAASANANGTADGTAAGSAAATAGTPEAGEEPRVRAFDGGVTAATAAATEAAFNAGRSSAQPAGYAWQSPSGCCVRPPVSRAFGPPDEEDV
ncbi:hypothetical protein COHA_008222 [Chlorella ohadii]|uniref:Fibronectin type-III domain-containing protein n=1 Tax=Chlorella ohadii TaxID=2649997 RepID=A0AAD5DLN9_9CHLO|nr:hypothetical protein COHA_008222 [Chlorella ohadii]